jgi:NitT/TauT family transport system substrate-binding protein
MRTRRVRGTAPLATGLILVLAAGCSSGARAAHAVGVEKPDLTVAVVPAVDSAGFFVALHEGLFRDRGLDVRFVPAISSETVIADQAKVGSVDTVRLQRVVDVMHQFIGFPPFNIDSMLMRG